MARNKVLSHPDKELIIQWLTEGIPLRDIEANLAHKYPRKNQEHLRIGFSTIQAFKKKHLNLNDDLLREVRKVRELTKQTIAAEEIKAEVVKTTAYQEAIKNLADVQLNTRNEMIKVWTLIENRLQVLFEKANNSEHLDKNTEKLIQGYLTQFMAVIDQHKKYEEGYREQVDVNVNVNVMNNQVKMMQDALRETLAEVDPEITIAFMAKLHTKMKAAVKTSDPLIADKHAAILDHALGNISIGYDGEINV
jgi:hypothetical protein